MVTHVAQTELMVFVVAAECLHVENGHQTREGKRTLYEPLFDYPGQRCTSTGVSPELTFTSLCTLRPCVISVSVGRPSAVLEPSTTGSATTDLAGFLEGAALKTCHHSPNRRGDDWLAD